MRHVESVNWQFTELPDGRLQSPGGRITTRKGFDAAIALYVPRYHTLKEVCLEIDWLLNWPEYVK